jgi:2-methylisocitrate lyase-like PEP mutase family enzyme
MSDSKAARFLELHRPGAPLLMPNVWDAGSARILEHLGFQALATTSSGFAATLGRLDGSVSREEALAHAASIVASTDLPVSADLENCFAEEPSGVAETIRRARGVGLAGGSVEDFTGDDSSPIYEFELAVERVRAAAEAAEKQFVLTARAENHLHGRDDLEDTVRRLVAYREAGADVVFAPGVRDAEAVRRIVESVEIPVSVLAPGAPPVPELAALGVSRISVGGTFAFAALGALVQAAQELRDQGTYGFTQLSRLGVSSAREAFAPGAARS